ncbi:hypothetical protein OS493_015314, partial [Desmophyllum pertusum]
MATEATTEPSEEKVEGTGESRSSVGEEEETSDWVSEKRTGVLAGTCEGSNPDISTFLARISSQVKVSSQTSRK